MAQFQVYNAQVAFNGPAVNMARIVDENNDPIVVGDVDSISYTVYEADSNGSGLGTPVTGHDGVALDPVDVMFDSLVTTDDAWAKDNTGYNFKHAIDMRDDEAFPERNKLYYVHYIINLVSGGDAHHRIACTAI